MTDLYTRCTGCQQIYRITLADLRSGRGHAHCSVCNTCFDCLASLALIAEQTEAATSETRIPNLTARVRQNQTEVIPATPNTRKSPGTLLLVSCSLMLMTALLLQVWQTRQEQILNIPEIRPLLEKSCELLDCQLPPLRAPHLFRVEQRAIELDPATGTIHFSLTFSNTAGQALHFPDIQLTLLELSGAAVAQRRFSPAEYLPVTARNDTMGGNASHSLQLRLLMPDQAFSGYEIRFL